VRAPAEQAVKDIRRLNTVQTSRVQEKDNIMNKTFKYEDIKQVPAEAGSTSNVSKFHNKEREIHE